MADPQISDYFRCMVIFKHKSLDVKDTFVNNFVFRNLSWLGNPDDAATHMANAIKDFYTVPATGVAEIPNSEHITQYFAASRLEPTVEVRVYDLGQPKGLRFPMVRTFDATYASGASHVEEVCVALTTIAGMNRPRFRGRIYLGPLVASTITSDPGQRTRVHDGFRHAVRSAADRLTKVPGIGWSVLSQKDGQARQITGGWVDNAFDIIRNRGPEWTQRALWGSYDGKPAGWTQTR